MTAEDLDVLAWLTDIPEPERPQAETKPASHGPKRQSWNGALGWWFIGYVAALSCLGLAAYHASYMWVVLLSILVAVAGMAVHRYLDARGTGPLQWWQALALAVVVEIGIWLCVQAHGRIFSLPGFIGVSLVGFGASRFALAIRMSQTYRRPTAWLFAGDLAVGFVLVLSGHGGWPLLIGTLGLIFPAVGFGTEAALDVLPVQDVKGDCRSQLVKWVGILGFLLGVALMVPSVGLLAAVAVVVAGFAFVGAIASNTDADIGFCARRRRDHVGVVPPEPAGLESEGSQRSDCCARRLVHFG